MIDTLPSLATEPNQGTAVAIVDPLQGDDWDALLDSFSDATAFHTSGWARVLSRSYAHRPFYLKFVRAREVAALVPLMEVKSPLTGSRALCLPFSDFCGPLMSDSNLASAIAGKLVDLMSERRWKHVELRGGESALFPNACHGSTFYGHTLPLAQGASELWDQLGSPVRRAIRKAAHSGVSVEVTTTREAIYEFYRLHGQTRRRHGLPPQPVRFFLNIFEEMINAGRGFLILARARSRVVAAAMFFEFKDTAIYKFGASDSGFQDLRPNNLVMWEAIRCLAQRGCRLLHLGRTELENEGLRRFKFGWGATEEQIQYLRFGKSAPGMTQRGQNYLSFSSTVFRMLPLAVNKLAGAAIYPHLD
jgi:hypothetical protein